MIIDLNHLSNKKIQVVICGSGPAGVSLALDLEKKKNRMSNHRIG